MLIRRLLPLLLPMTLTGCAFSGGPVGSPPPVSRPAEAGTVILHRNRSAAGLFGTMHVRLDGQRLYDLGMGRTYSMRLDPGHYVIDYTIGLNDCGGVLHIKPGETHRVVLEPNCMIHDDIENVWR